MKLSDISKEELELMSYDDVAYLILKNANKKMKINDLFQKVCKLLNLNEQVFEEQIADFFEDGFWDLKEKHSEKVIIDEDDDEVFVEEQEDNEEEIEDETFYDEEDDNEEDDLKDLVVIDEDEEGENL